jgi:hypothetical protein
MISEILDLAAYAIYHICLKNVSSISMKLQSMSNLQAHLYGQNIETSPCYEKCKVYYRITLAGPSSTLVKIM